MKHLFGISLIVLFASVLGCKTNSTSPNNSQVTVASGTMSATVKGKAWKSDGVKGFRYAPTATPNLQFEGWTNQPFVQIPFNVSPAITGAGTYPLITQVTSLSQKAIEGAYNTMQGTYNDTTWGSMTITSLTDKNVQGTFNFTAVDDFHNDTVIITNGQFNIPLD